MRDRETIIRQNVRTVAVEPMVLRRCEWDDRRSVRTQDGDAARYDRYREPAQWATQIRLAERLGEVQ